MMLFLAGLFTKIDAQHLDVEGHSQMRGRLDLAHMNDTTVTVIGLGAGLNVDLDTVFAIFRKNTFIGGSAGRLNHDGKSNTALGYESLRDNSNGYENTAIGHGAMKIGNGDENTAVGFDALGDAIAPKENTAIGK